MKYNLFISYSTDPDYKLSKNLETFLESFSKLAARYGKNLEHLEVFRDGSDFKPSGSQDEDRSINSMLVDNLKQSEWLIVLCSENAAKSNFVNHEIEWFLKNRGRDKVLAAFTEGEDPGANPEKYFSPLLLKYNLHHSICYDLRAFKKQSDDWNKVRDLGEEMTKLAAHLYDTSINDIMPFWKIAERKKKIERRINNIVRGGLVILSLMFAIMVLQFLEIRKKSNLNEMKSTLATMANFAFKGKETDRKVSHDTLVKALAISRDGFEGKLLKEQAIINNLLNDLQVNYNIQPFYSQSIKTENRGLIRSAKTVEDLESYFLYTLSEGDNAVVQYTLNKKHPTSVDQKTSVFRHPKERNITSFEPINERHLIIYDNKGYLYLLDNQNRDSQELFIPGISDMVSGPGIPDEGIQHQLFVTTRTEWMVYNILLSGSLELYSTSSNPYNDISQLHRYDDGKISFLDNKRLYLSDSELINIDRILLIPTPVLLYEGIQNYAFGKSSNALVPEERDILVISLGRVVEIYRRATSLQYYRINSIDIHQSTITSIDFNARNDVLIGSSDKTATIWRDDLLYKKLVGHRTGIKAASFIDDEVALTIDEANIARIWKLKDIAVLHQSIGAGKRIKSIKHLADNKVGILTEGERITVNYGDGELFLLPTYSSVDSLEFISVFEDFNAHLVLDSVEMDQLTYSERGSSLVTGDEQGQIQYYELPNTAPLLTWKGSDFAIKDINFFSGTAYILSGGTDQQVKVWQKKGINMYL